MRRSNINFHKSNSDRKAERSFKANFYQHLQPLRLIPDKIHYHLRSKFPAFHAKMTSYISKVKSNFK